MMVGNEIRRLRKNKGLNLTQLGELSGISRSYLSQIELGNRGVSAEALTKIAEGLGVSKLYLYRSAGYLEATDMLELIDENKQLHEALRRAYDSSGADITDYFKG